MAQRKIQGWVRDLTLKFVFVHTNGMLLTLAVDDIALQAGCGDIALWQFIHIINMSCFRDLNSCMSSCS